MYNYPVPLDDDILYIISSNNYAQSQLHIIQISDYKAVMKSNAISTSLPYINGTITCDFTFKGSGISSSFITEVGYYYIGVLLDISNEEDSRVFFNLDTLIQVINVYRVNNRIVILKYLNVDEADPETFYTATKQFIENYNNILCLIGTSKIEQRKEVDKLLSDSDILLLVPTPVYEANCFENIVVISPSISQRLLLILPKMLYSFNRMIIITYNDDANKSLLKFIRNKVSHYSVACCVDNPIYFDRTTTTSASLISEIDALFGDGANFLISTNYKDAETILKYLHDDGKYSDRKKYLASVVNIDESFVYESSNPEVWEGVLFPVTYLYTKRNTISTHLAYYIETFYGVSYSRLSEQLIHIYDAIKFVQYGVEKSLSTAGSIIRSTLYNTELELAEGDLTFYQSNHFSHYVMIGIVKKEESKYFIDFCCSYTSLMFPFIYAVYQDNESLECSWLQSENGGKRSSKTAAVVYMSDFPTNFKESYEGLVLLESSVNLMNQGGGILGSLVELLTDNCPSDTDTLANLALFYKTVDSMILLYIFILMYSFCYYNEL